VRYDWQDVREVGRLYKIRMLEVRNLRHVSLCQRNLKNDDESDEPVGSSFKVEPVLVAALRLLALLSALDDAKAVFDENQSSSSDVELDLGDSEE
jgi:hypothetical protein